MELESIKKTYAAYSAVYDAIFKWFFFPRISHALGSMNIVPGDRILDVGVGTGLSLPLYPKDCTVVGVDLSDAMLKQARQKIKKNNLDHIEVVEMDAMDLLFEDDSFDKVFISHVVSVVPDPYKAMREVRRVCKKGGEVVVVNHFKSTNKAIAAVEKIISPISEKVGWRSDLGLHDFIKGAGLTVRDMYMLNRFDFWHMIFAVNEK